MEKGAVAKQRLAGRRLHLSRGGEHPSNSKGRFLGEEWVYGCPAGQRDRMQGRVGETIGAMGRGAVTTSSPLWATASESRARLVKAFWEELPLPTLFVPCRGAAFNLASPGPGERKRGRRMWVTCTPGAGAGVGTGAASHRELLGARCPAPGAR